MAKPENNKGVRRLLNSFFFSMHGIGTCFKTEEAFRQEVVLALILIPLGIWLGETAAEKVILSGTIFIILIVEILNSAIERAIDRISFERHELSKEAKDMGSAAVFLSLLLAAFCWGVILLVP